ncbi:hypothetical protein RchiOBHm_Chr6g0297411 [Rosa chinensis]|uniref:Transmembrane protein n=1 Tax=Rosa chinensis TaxID=74649 RepID=A0A2P6PXN1_ROSCH|nr:uncharacterized protein LOC112174580 isoform X1 [Rosa chinensis]PRQ26693.1 hypothetical protein RchiOBHm_Chr6g0297411 [Rosa chinensis]
MPESFAAEILDLSHSLLKLLNLDLAYRWTINHRLLFFLAFAILLSFHFILLLKFTTLGLVSYLYILFYSHGFFFSKPKKATFLLSSHRVGIQDYEFPEAKIGILSQEYKHGKENRCRTLEYEVALEGFSYVFLFYNYELWDLNISGEKLEEICIRWEFDSSDDSRCGIYCTLRWSIHDFLEGFFI